MARESYAFFRDVVPTGDPTDLPDFGTLAPVSPAKRDTITGTGTDREYVLYEYVNGSPPGPKATATAQNVDVTNASNVFTGTLSGDFTGGFEDVNGYAVAVTIQDGSVSITGNQYTVTMDAAFMQSIANGATVSRSFDFTCRTLNGPASDPATITFDITGVSDVTNQAPVIANAIPAFSVDEGATVVFDIPVNYMTDPEGGAVTYTVTLEQGAPLPSYFVEDQNPPTGIAKRYSITAPAGSAQSETIRIRGADPQGAVTDGFVPFAINDVIAPPTTFDDAFSATLNVATVIPILQNDTAPVIAPIDPGSTFIQNPQNQSTLELAYEWTTANFTASINPATGSLTFTATAAGTYEILYRTANTQSPPQVSVPDVGYDPDGGVSGQGILSKVVITVPSVAVTPLPADPQDPASFMTTEMQTLTTTFAYRNDADDVLYTHWTAQSGDWSDPATWEGNMVPGADAKVVILDTHTVVMDANPTADLKTVRVDGKLTRPTGASSELRTENLYISSLGEYEEGTSVTPVGSGFVSKTVYLDTGDINVTADPLLQTRGFISHGAVEIHGEVKTKWGRLGAGASAGATQITLASAPTNWSVGDEIVITGGRFIPLIDPGVYNGSGHTPGPEIRTFDTFEDEERTITAINGATITLNAALDYDHLAPSGEAALLPYVGMLTKNVQHESEVATPVRRRAHAMHMMNQGCSVEYSCWKDMGRTDKSAPSFNAERYTAITSDANVQGRYSWHFHNAGFSPTTAQFNNNTVRGNPGLGVVHHNCWARINDNFVYDCFGTGIFSETANEAGPWSGNLVCKTKGVAGGAKASAYYNIADKGRDGSSFFNSSRNISMTNNVACSAPGGTGFVWMVRDGRNSGALSYGPSLNNTDFRINIPPDRSTLIAPEVTNGRDTIISESYVPIRVFTGNVAYGCSEPFHVIKASPVQQHMLRSIFEDFTAWECPVGGEIQYVGHYSLKNFYLVGSVLGQNASTGYGFRIYVNNPDVVLQDFTIKNFVDGVRMAKEATEGFQNQIAGYATNTHDWRYYFVNVQFVNVTNNYVNDPGAQLGVADRILATGDLGSPGQSIVNTNATTPVVPFSNSQSVELTFDLTDELGTASYGTSWDPILVNGRGARDTMARDGYYQFNGENVVVFIIAWQGRLQTDGTYQTIEVPVSLANFNASSLAGYTDNGTYTP